MPMPLEGLRVIDWTIWQQGPVASAMLGDLGAEVIKIESRDGGDPGRGLVAVSGTAANRANFYIEANNRNKQSIALDLKQAEAREIVYKLAAVSDVFVQNFRKGVADRLGLGYDALRAHNERLDLRNATGYGPDGPESGTRRSTSSASRARESCSRPASRTCRRSRSAAASPTRWARSCWPTACWPR